MVDALMQSVSKRFNAFEYEKCFQLAAVLDPRLKLAWCKTSEAKLIKSFLLMEDDSTVSVVEGELTTSSTNEPSQKRCRLFSLMGNIGSTSTSSTKRISKKRFKII